MYLVCFVSLLCSSENFSPLHFLECVPRVFCVPGEGKLAIRSPITAVWRDSVSPTIKIIKITFYEWKEEKKSAASNCRDVEVLWWGVSAPQSQHFPSLLSCKCSSGSTRKEFLEEWLKSSRLEAPGPFSSWQAPTKLQYPSSSTWKHLESWNGMEERDFFFPPSFDFRENATKFLLQIQVEFFLPQFEIYMINCSLFLPNSPVGSRNPLWVWRSSHGESFPPSLAEAGAVTPPTAHPAPALPALTVTMTRFCPFCELREQGKILVKHINSLKNILEKRFCF